MQNYAIWMAGKAGDVKASDVARIGSFVEDFSVIETLRVLVGADSGLLTSKIGGHRSAPDLWNTLELETEEWVSG